LQQQASTEIPEQSSDNCNIMKIATYNVNGINGRLPVLLRWLQEADPDIVCLQELKASQEKLPETAIREAGYRAIWKGQKSWNGVAFWLKTNMKLQKSSESCRATMMIPRAVI